MGRTINPPGGLGELLGRSIDELVARGWDLAEIWAWGRDALGVVSMGSAESLPPGVHGCTHDPVTPILNTEPALALANHRLARAVLDCAEDWTDDHGHLWNAFFESIEGRDDLPEGFPRTVGDLDLKTFVKGPGELAALID